MIVPGSKPPDLMATDLYAYKHEVQRGPLNRQLQRRFASSANEVIRRQKLVPSIDYQTDLPIATELDRIEKTLKNHRVIIVAGETGSGKTTQLPLACLRVGLGVRGMIGHTQPRRLAARAVAERIATQLGVPLGTRVGYAVRFDDRVSADTLIKEMTDGLLLAEIRRDRFLTKYDTIIVDEAHERSLNIDFLLGYLRRLIDRRQDLKVIITSATIDVDAFSKHFGKAPVIVVEGRGHPVEIRYRPPEDDIEEAVRGSLEEILLEPKGNPRDILMFLSGEREILNWSHWLRRHFANQFELLPLYARLPQKDQRRIFESSRKQRILLSTNVAETSLTVPNVKYVIDLGDARVSRYSFRARIQRLPIESISQASAEQRAGRCGRVAAGICYRLYDELQFAGRQTYTDPEIKRTNLASVLLQMRVLRFGTIENFPFLDPPNAAAVNSATQLLQELGALDGDELTRVGQVMASLPIDPRLGRMLIEANALKALSELLIIVSALAVQDPRLRQIEKQQAADQAQAQFNNRKSDFISFLKLWDWAESQRAELTRRDFRQLLEKTFVSPTRYGEWRALHRQLLLSCARVGMKPNKDTADFASIHSAILKGSLAFVGMRTDRDAYVGPRDLPFHIFPGSGLFKRKPKWVVAAEIATTQRTYARCVADVEPAWIEGAGKEQLKERVRDSYWDEEQAQAMAFMDASLFGLPVVKNRRVPLASHDRSEARRLFVLHVLVLGVNKLRAKIIEQNQSLVAECKHIHATERRADVVASERELVEFYLQRLPETIFDLRSFQFWHRKNRAEATKSLAMKRDDILLRPEIHLRDDAFPAELKLADSIAPLHYRFAPGEDDDGISLRVSIAQLPYVNQGAIDWLVPGFVEQKCREMLKALPRGLRKQLAPVPNRVSELLPILLREDVYRRGSLSGALSKWIKSLFNVSIEPDEWKIESLSPFLEMNIQVVDAKDKLIDQCRNVHELRERVLGSLSESMNESFREKYERRGLKDFPKEGLPLTKVVASNTGPVTVFPVLVDQKESVDLLLQLDSRMQREATTRGLCRLMSFAEHQSVKYLLSEIRSDKTLGLHYVALGTSEQLEETLILGAIKQVYFEDGKHISSQQEFDELRRTYRGVLVEKGSKLIESARSILVSRQEIALATQELTRKAYATTRADLLNQLIRLVPPDFLVRFDATFLSQLPRYLTAMKQRLEQLEGRVRRDIEHTLEIQKWEARLDALAARHGYNEKTRNISYLLGEYRVALFCQRMRTRERISAKRLTKVFEIAESEAVQRNS